MLVFDKGIILGISDGKVLGTILRNSDVIKLGIDFGTVMGSLDQSINDFNVCKNEGLLIENHWDLLMVKCLTLMKAPKLDILMVK